MVLFLAVILVALASRAARFLVVDEPEKSDAIVVLAGETNVRPAHALELLRKGVAPLIFLNAEKRNLIYDQRLTELRRDTRTVFPKRTASRYARSLDSRPKPRPRT